MINLSQILISYSEEITTNWEEESCTTFDAMDLKEDLLRGIFAYGFEKPSAIQQVKFSSISLYACFLFA